MPALQAFISMHLSLYKKLVMIDGGIIDNVFKKLEDIDAMLIEKDN